MAAAGRSTFKPWVGSLILLLISSIIACVIAEYTFRTYQELVWRRSAKYFQHKLYTMLPDSPLEYGLIGGAVRENKIPGTDQTWTYQINSEGFRGEEFPAVSNRQRVLFIGDSYTFGWAVEQDKVLPTTIAHRLAQPPFNMQIDAYNLGVPGYNTFHEYHLLQDVVDRYAPDLVVLGYVMNHFEPQLNVPERPSVRYQYVTSWLMTFVKAQINYYLYDGEAVLNAGNVLGAGYTLPLRERGPKWATQRQAYGDMAALANGHNIPLLTVIYPDYTSDFTDAYPFTEIHVEVTRWAQENDVESIDLLNFLRNKNHREYWVEGDGHPNGKAFEEAAQILAPVIFNNLQ